MGGGCAYFNSFYLAKKNFSDAELEYRRNEERVTSDARSKYQEAIKWSSEVYNLYPDSRYVDDSLFIYGMASYRTRDYVMARNVFEQLITAYPNSGYVLDAKYFKARSLMGIDRLEDASIIFRELILEQDSEIRGKAGLALAEIAYMQEDWEGLLQSSQDVLDADPDDRSRTSALIYHADALLHLERYEEAIETLSDMGGKTMLPEERFRTNTIIAEAQAHLGRYDEALESLSSLENRGEFVPFEPRIRLEIGHIQEMSGQEMVAEDTYRKLAGDFPDSLTAREAWYRIGIILLSDLSNADEAKTAFDEVSKVQGQVDASWTADAKIKSALIDTMKARIDHIDAVREDPALLAGARYSLAELYQYSFDRPDSALTQYREIIQESPDSEFASMSRYFILLYEKADGGEVTDAIRDEAMEEVVREYPDSEFSGRLRVELGEVDLPPDVEALRQAENVKYDTGDPTQYLPLYQAVADDYPGTKSAYQARFVIAYETEHAVGDIDKALELYRSLAEEEPTYVSSLYVERARDKLSFYRREPELIAEIQRYLAGNAPAPRRTATATEITPSAGAETGIALPEYNGMQKIRARNARIRSRYYSD